MKNFEKIRRALEGEMTSDELKEFRKEMEVNPDLSEEFKIQEVESLTIDELVEQRLLAEIKTQRSQEVRLVAKKNNVFTLKRIFALAATLAFLLSGYFIIGNDDSPSEIAQTYYKKYPPNFSPSRNIIKSDKNDISIILSALEDNDRSKMESEIQRIKNEPTEDIENYYLGHAYYKIDSFDLAIKSFNEFLNSDLTDTELRANAKFYASLAYISINKKLAGKSKIKELLQDPTMKTYSKQLNQLLQEF